MKEIIPLDEKYFMEEMTQEEFEFLTKNAKIDLEFKINFIKWLDENYEFPNP